ncbi:MAG: S41 family peptidase [Acidobacteria bacterium]|nr:S41 family peptidase [Acidobacteriota bacterium]MDW7984084.1 S41 family peptidase [Acidobacteriota bacterium]
MKKWLRVFGGVFLGAAALAFGALQASYRQKPTDRVLRDVGEALRTIETYYSGEWSSDTVLKWAIVDMLLSLDPHSNFLDERAYQRMMEEQRGSFYGIGVSINSIQGVLTVLMPIPGTPAAKAGLRAGDVITEINGESTKGQPLDDLIRKLRGPKNTEVRLTVVREGYDAPFSVTLVRDEIPLVSVVNAFVTSDGIGYLRIRNFAERTYEEIQSHLEDFQKAGLKGLVLDLRDNPGGLLEEAVRVTDLFLPPGLTIVTVRGRGAGRVGEYKSEQEDPYETLPLIVLTNRGTASASEIVAGAIQDHDRGLIVGETTWGKGLVQTLYPLSFNTAVAITTARYYTPSGRLIQRSYASFFEYSFPQVQSSPLTPVPSERPQFQTDLGRFVTGGGGIQPDVPVESFKDPAFLQAVEQEFYRRVAPVGGLPYLEFARLFAPVEKADEERRHHSTRQLLSPDFQVDDALLTRFQDFLRQRGIPFDETAFRRDREAIRQVLRRELIERLWGESEGYRYFLTFDPQFKKAQEVIPKARQMWSQRLQSLKKKEVSS